MNKYTKYILFFLVISFLYPLESIKIKAPNGREKLKFSQDYEIKWKLSKNIKEYDKVQILLSYDDGIIWSSIAITENDGRYIWNIPAINSHVCLIRVQTLDGTIKGESKKVFRAPISRPSEYFFPRRCLQPNPKGTTGCILLKSSWVCTPVILAMPKPAKK